MSSGSTLRLLTVSIFNAYCLLSWATLDTHSILILVRGVYLTRWDTLLDYQKGVNMYLKDKSKSISLRLSEEEYNSIKIMSETYKLSFSDTIRKLLFSIQLQGGNLNDKKNNVNN